jgi:uncharacterized repeat protein (TIGR03803 family)
MLPDNLVYTCSAITLDMTKMTIGELLMPRISLVLPLLALGFVATLASAQSNDSDASDVKFTTLHSFSGTEGKQPGAGLVQAANGDFYGTTLRGGANCAANAFCGTIFRINPSGVLTTVYNFCAQSGSGDGIYPNGLIQATNRDLYGTTVLGGANCAVSLGCGTVFRITPSGVLTTLYRFCTQAGCPDGSSPNGTLVQAANGDLYGTTAAGGASNHGTVFKITPSGTLTTLYSFCSQAGCADGSDAVVGLVQGANGDLYGGTAVGGAGTYCLGGSGGCGTLFKITPAGALTTLHSFCSQSGCPDGTDPSAGLIATSGNLYGTATFGGANGHGTIFKMTPNGTLTTLYSFCSQPSCSDGFSPMGVLQATSGNLYGLSVSGGTFYGTIFKITPSGTLTTLYSFCSEPGCTDGANPTGMLQATNGLLYGTANSGGANGSGTIFSLSTGQAPFIETRPASGEVGKTVTILGYKLTGATSVTFNGTPAAFTVESATQIATTVPTGATTGKVEVITPDGTLSSNVAFRIP